MILTAKDVLPHYEYEKMVVTIEPFTNETQIEIEVQDGYKGKPNSRVTLSLDDFARIVDMVVKYKHADQIGRSA